MLAATSVSAATVTETKTSKEATTEAKADSKEEVKAAYRRLVKIHHPDRGGIQDNFIKLNNAYEVLKEYYNI